MAELSSVKFPLRLGDKMLLVAGAWVLGVAFLFFAAAPPVREEVLTETRTTSWLTTETRSATQHIAETRTSTITVTTVSPTTRTITETIYIPVTVAFGVTQYTTVVLVRSLVSEVMVTHMSIMKVTVTRTETFHSTGTVTYKSPVQVTYTQRVFQAPGVQTILWIAIGVAVLGSTYRRINEYRTRLHIYYEILQYVARSPRIASHIMRKCNLETEKFNKYISQLQMRGFVNVVQRDDAKEYVATEKSFEYLRDEKLARFIAELT